MIRRLRRITFLPRRLSAIQSIDPYAHPFSKDALELQARMEARQTIIQLFDKGMYTLLNPYYWDCRAFDEGSDTLFCLTMKSALLKLIKKGYFRFK